MALGAGDEASQRAKEWLLETQTSAGYWDSIDPGKEKIRDTAFILWVFWPDVCSTSGGTVVGGDKYTRSQPRNAQSKHDLQLGRGAIKS